LGSDSSAHVENRVGEPCANPYLAMAAQLSAGLEGLDPGEHPDTGLAAAGLPGSLRESVDAFRASARARELLGPALARCLIRLKQSEVSRFEAWCESQRAQDGEVTAWEHREYFRVY